MGFETPTPIQEQAIPIILQGRDLIACAQTGTGKTAAFLLPILHQIAQNEEEFTDTLVVVPTRELAVQIDQELEGFGYFTGASSLPIYGGRDGASFEQEKKALSQGANIIVATPGRLISHLNAGYVKLDKLRHFVLDEADRMLDMGFAGDIMSISNYLPRERQTLLFSATMPNEIRTFAKQLLKDPAQISMAVSKPAAGILQGAYEVEDELKPRLVSHLLEGKEKILERVLIFSSTKAKVKDVTATLKKAGLNVRQVHSDLSQDEREEILRSFKSGKVQILVATDILSRGIDVKGINLVINYDVPGDGEDYVHRVGRTARADSDGVALTFINRRDRRRIKAIESLIESEVRRLPLPADLQAAAEKLAAKPQRNRRSGPPHGGGKGGGRGRGRSGNKRRETGGKRPT